MTETIPTGNFISSIAVNPPGQLVGTPNLITGIVNVKYRQRRYRGDYTNRKKMATRTTGFLEICKQGPGEG